MKQKFQCTEYFTKINNFEYKFIDKEDAADYAHYTLFKDLITAIYDGDIYTKTRYRKARNN